MAANAPSSLGMSSQRRLANPIILHHSSPIHLAFRIFSQRAICGFPAGSPRSQCVMTTKHLQGHVGVREDATKHNLRPCHCPLHAARNSLMTDTFKKASNCGLSTSNYEQNGGSVAHKIISQQLKRSLYVYATYPEN